jgi:hypothetical protein
MEALAAELAALSSAVRAAAAPDLGSSMQELQAHVRRISTQLEGIATGGGGGDATSAPNGRTRIDKMSAEVSVLTPVRFCSALRTRLREASLRRQRCHGRAHVLCAHCVLGT